MIVKMGKHGKTTHGDVRAWATHVLHENLEKVINMKAKRRKPYYIMVIIKDGYDGPPVKSKQQITKDFSKKKIVTNRILILEEAPIVPMLGSSLWRVDNKIGEVKCIYVLPEDKPMITSFEVGEESELVHNCGKGMPLAYSKV